MKILKRIVFTLGIIGILLIIVSFMLPSKTHVERSLVMKAQPEVIYPQINNLHNWEKWSPWHRMDSNMQIVYDGAPEGKGAKYAWTSEKMGDGSMEITEAQPFSNITTKMNFGGSDAFGNYKLEKVDSGTKVTWSMDTDAENVDWLWYVPSKYFGLFLDKMVGPDFEAGLNNLNALTSNMSATEQAPEYKIETTEVKPQNVLTIRTTCSAQEISSKLEEIYGQLMAHSQKNGLQMAGAPFAIYHNFTYEKVDMEAGIPVNKAGKTAGNINAYEMKGGKVLKTNHYGKYEASEYAHAAVDKYIQQNDVKVIGAPWEIYVTDPGEVKDTAKWLTEVYYPIQ